MLIKKLTKELKQLGVAMYMNSQGGFYIFLDDDEDKELIQRLKKENLVVMDEEMDCYYSTEKGKELLRHMHEAGLNIGGMLKAMMTDKISIEAAKRAAQGRLKIGDKDG